MNKITPEGDEVLSRAELERLHWIIVRDSVFNCPMCRMPQTDNGLIAWCERGHVYRLATDDLRYDET